MSSAGQVVTQLIVDSSGAREGTNSFVADMGRAKSAAEATSQAVGGTLESAQRKWNASLAATDPVFKAQLQMQQAMEKQTLTGNRAVELGITTQVAATAQLEKVRQKHLEMVEAAGQVKTGWLSMLNVEGLLERSMIRLGELFAIREILIFTKDVFENAAALKDQAERVGENVEAFQAQTAVLRQAGLGAEETVQSIGKLTRNIGTAMEATGPARSAFHDLGITFQDLAGGPESALPKVASQLLKVQDASERARLEVALFGKTGQQLESALRGLADPTTDLIEKQKALGQVLGTGVVDAAHDADVKINQSWNSIKVGIAPVIVGITSSLVDLIGKMKELGESAPKTNPFYFLDPFGLQQLKDSRAASAHVNDNVPKSVLDAQMTGFGTFAPIPSATTVPPQTQFGQKEWAQYLKDQEEAARLTGLSAQERAAETEAIKQSVKYQELSGVAAKDLNHTYQGAKETLDAQTLAHARNLGLLSEHNKAAEKIKETFGQYLTQLQEEARVAGETTTKRAIELDVIKGGEISQKNRGVLEKDINKTLAFNTKELGQQRVDSIAATETRKILAPIELQIANNLQLAGIALSTNRDQRQLALQIAQQELSTGVKLTDEDKKQLALTQAKNDASRMKDYLEDLRTEVKLAGMSADERQRESAAIQAGHNRATQEQQDEIRGLIAVRQETERWRGVVDDISNGFQGFFENVLNNGKLSFQSLWDSIKQSFVKMLAYMATQALIQPIIIPMVESFGGAIGGSSGISSLLGGGSGGSPLGMLSSAGDLSSMFGGSGGLLSGLGGALGFAAPMAPLATSAALGGGLGTISSSVGVSGAMNTGGLFGATTFGSFLGGAGLGALAGSMLFHGADSGIGSMGGAAAGALAGSLILPGVGTIIGGLLGGIAGGGLGSLTGSSNQGAISNFTNGGLGQTLFKAGGGNNGQLATQATGSINTALKALQDAGVNVSLGNISGLSIGSDKSYVYDFAGGKQKLAGGQAGVEATVNAILDRILPSASSSDDSINAVLQKYRDNGGINSGNISQLASELQQAKQAKDAADKAEADLKTQVDAFGPAITAALKKIADPTGAAFDDLITAQKTRLAQATALGVDVGQLTALNDAEINQYLHGLTQAQLQGLISANDITGSVADQAKALIDTMQAATDLAQGFKSLTGNIKDMTTQAQDAGRTASQIAQSWGNANTSLTKASTALLISGPGLSPIDQYNNSRQQFNALRSAAYGGNVNSANDISSFASQFLQTSFQYNGSTQAYGGDLGYVKDTLNGLAGFSKSQQDLAQQQADSMASAVTLLQTISQGISDGTDTTSSDLQNLQAQVAGLTAEIKQANLQNRVAA